METDPIPQIPAGNYWNWLQPEDEITLPYTQPTQAAPPALPPMPAQPVRRFTRKMFLLACTAYVILFSLLIFLLHWPFAPMMQTMQRTQRMQRIEGRAIPTPRVPKQAMFQAGFGSGWGNAWGADAQSQPFTVSAGQGIIIGDTSGFYTATFQSSPRENMSVLLTASISHFDGANFGPILRWQDGPAGESYYKAYLDGASLVLVKRLPGEANSTQVATVPFPAQANVFYFIRFEAMGTTLLAKAWPAQEIEPDWQITITDRSLPAAGQGGLRAYLAPGQIVIVKAFSEG